MKDVFTTKNVKHSDSLHNCLCEIQDWRLSNISSWINDESCGLGWSGCLILSIRVFPVLSKVSGDVWTEHSPVSLKDLLSLYFIGSFISHF